MTLSAQDLIRKKRDGGSFSPEEIGAFVKGVAESAWADYQISALLMACFINGLNLAEQKALTEAMLNSGERLDFSDADAPVADKHSTGGVGDKTSLVIAPLAAACGVAVPMISGRGLGHTGGTLDKLEAIPGYRVDLSLGEFRRIVKECGFSMIGQTAEIVPADKKLYALRDATSTVESIPLIVASIMSKKLAEGLDALVLDVKTGSGAFMREFEKSKELARALCETGNACGVRTEAIISDMNQPLGEYVGNALEVYECLKIMRGETTPATRPTLELSVELTARMVLLSGASDTIEDARLAVARALEGGAALEKFRLNVELQGGEARVCDDPEILLDKNLLEVRIESPKSGFVRAVDAHRIGRAVGGIGGGRMRVEDRIDYAVGFRSEKKIGDAVREKEPLGTLFCRTREQAAKIFANLERAYTIGEEKPSPDNLKLIREIVR